MFKNYSVLMSVYYKERPEYLRESMQSIYDQTIPTDDFILVCDGPLTEELDSIIKEMQEKFGDRLSVHRLEKNIGLGNALNWGIKLSKNELIARMDSDDIAFPNRCERQINEFTSNKKLDICSGAVLEFERDVSVIIGKRNLPLKHEDIIAFSKKRNPFNHPAVMYKKNAVLEAGSYSEKYHLFEDYYLWIRMLMNQCYSTNISDPIVYMRASKELYDRRGGWTYTKNMLEFHRWLYHGGWSSKIDYLCGAIPHAMVCIVPTSVRRFVYKKLHSQN